ncbi:hypothetical protein JAAARDRAFT_126581 [Jaapia argillacea MUCL 33604]|uniref:Uncharacterized protein n=1 Tax=Jaapia argillacea MUCL 33604 TaxID=933084 RepID=A0A067QB51_9AGAM|nr:hypothetical protein JAAARDRAFT_126581 [Jaapia argillacea MUCL 33604]
MEPDLPTTTPSPPVETVGTDHSSKPVRSHIRPPLSPAQERRLIDNLDERFLDITRAFKKRTLPSSILPTLQSYLTATHTLLSLILQIPPLTRTSISLRTTLLLRLTGDVMTCFAGYPPVVGSLAPLLQWMDELDRGWLAVIRGQGWNLEEHTGFDIPPLPNIPSPNAEINPNPTSPTSTMSQTERTRLRSLLITGTQTMEEWLSALDTDGEDYTLGLERLGLQQGFDDLFFRTLSEIGGFEGSEVEGMVGTC